MEHEVTETNWLSDIDWLAVGSVLQGFGTLVGAIAVIVAARVGSSTFKNWRQQKLSERRIEQAERILTATYKVRRGLSYVRSPMMLPHELAAAEESLKERRQWINDSAERQRRLSIAQAYYNRLNARKDDRQALEESQPMARALFGEELEKALDTLNRQYHFVQVYVDANYQDPESTDLNFQNEIRTALYEGYGGTDKNKMDQTIAKQVQLIEKICSPVLRLENGKREKSK